MSQVSGMILIPKNLKSVLTGKRKFATKKNNEINDLSSLAFDKVNVKNGAYYRLYLYEFDLLLQVLYQVIVCLTDEISNKSNH